METSLGTREDSRGVFDQLLSFSESLRQRGAHVEGLEHSILEVERRIQDIDDNDTTKNVGRLLSFWLKACNDEQADFSAESLITNLSQVETVLSRALKTGNVKQIASEIAAIKPQPGEDWSPKGELGSFPITRRPKHLPRFRRRVSEPAMGLEVTGEKAEGHRTRLSDWMKRLLHLAGEGTSKPQPAESVASTRDPRIWEVKITFIQNELPASSVGYFLWAFSELIQLTPEVEVVLDDWGSGSKWIKLKIGFKDLFAKKEVRETLGKARDAITSEYLDRPIEEVEKLRAESGKLQAERDKIRREAESLPDEHHTERLQQLEIMERLASIRAQELDNQLKHLEVVQRAAYLIKEGLILPGDVNIDINDVPYLRSIDRKLLPGASMDQIDVGENPDTDSEEPTRPKPS